MTKPGPTPRGSPSRSDPRPLAPPLKWAGGKRWQVPHVASLWRPYAATHRLVEPFCGGLAVALALQPARALLNDVNPHLVDFYRWLKRGLQIEVEMENDSRCFYAHRARFNELIAGGKTGGREAASLFYYLNRTGFNGLCRFNASGRFNVPFGRYATIRYRRDLRAYREVFGAWEFRSGDFARLHLDTDDFVYADPPYDVPFRQYAEGGFDWTDQVRLAEWLTDHPGPVVLANQATDRVCALYDRLHFALTFLPAPRRISCTGDRTPAREVLAVRNL